MHKASEKLSEAFVLQMFCLLLEVQNIGQQFLNNGRKQRMNDRGNGKIVAYAKAQGYYSVEYSGQWQDYEVYCPFLEGEDERLLAIVGLPLSILVQGETIRMSTSEESFQILDALYGDEEE